MNKRILLLSVVFAFSIASASAATSTLPTPESTIRSYTVSDVNVSDLQTKISTSTITGSFTLQSWQGSQSGVVYGVIATGKDGILSVTPLGRVDIIHKKELRKENFSYTIPKYLTGNVSFNLAVYTTTGLPLGGRLLATSTLVGTPATFSCAHTSSATSSIVCTTKTDNPLTVEYYKNLFVEPFSKEVLTPTQKKLTLDNQKLPAGQWYVVVTDTTTGEERVVQQKVEGAYGRILGVMTDAKGSILSTTVTTRSSKVSGATALVTLANGATGCGEVRVPFRGGVIVATTTSSCTSGTVQVVLEDAQKKTLDTFSTTFDTVAYTPPAAATTTPVTTSSPSSMTILYVSIALLLVISALALLYRKYRKDTPVTTLPTLLILLAAVSIGMFPTKTRALALQAYIQNYPNYENVWLCDLFVDKNKSSYIRGEILTVTTGTGLIYYDLISGDARGTGECTLELKEVSPSVPAYNGAAGLVYPDIINKSLVYNGATGPLSAAISPGSYSTTVPAALANGDNYLTTKFTLTGGVNGDSVAWDPSYPQVNFTVVTTPTVNVYFSMVSKWFDTKGWF